mgnify:CR=1 FL=1
MRTSKIIISGGGTGGHLFPALAIAEELKIRFKDVKILFVGSLGKMEMTKVPAAGYNIIGLWVDGFKRNFSLKNLMFPIKLFFSLIKSLFILLINKPIIVIGTGGYASGPLIFVANILNIPSLIQEQNSYPGITNKILSRSVDKIAVAYEGLERYFPEEKIIVTGNPIRKSIESLCINVSKAKKYFELNPNKQTLVVLGGSLGAKRINNLIAEKLDWFRSFDIQIIWQCGSLYYDKYKELSCDEVKILAFVNEMDQLYSSADFIISRAGAATLSELSCVGKPAILIPSPNVAENHQFHNAMAFANRNAAIVVTEKKLKIDFEASFKKLLNEEKQNEFIENIRQFAKPNAAKEIVNHIEELL